MVADKEFYYSTYHGKLSQTDVEGCLPARSTCCTA